MKITRIEAFQVAWNPNDRPQQRSEYSGNEKWPLFRGIAAITMKRSECGLPGQRPATIHKKRRPVPLPPFVPIRWPMRSSNAATK